jgi:hypothetical protein
MVPEVPWGVVSLAIEKSEAIEKPYHIALSPYLASGDYWVNSTQKQGIVALAIIVKSMPCKLVALYNTFAIFGPSMEV